MNKPKLMVEKIMSKEIERPHTLIFPHCDSRILHAVDAGCDYCKEATELQAERERLGVSNTGLQNRQWPCPADKARSSESLNAWRGNQAKTHEQTSQEVKIFVDSLRQNGLLPQK